MIAMLLCFALMLTACGAGGKDKAEDGKETAAEETGSDKDGTAAVQKDTDAMPHAVITVEKYGTITVALDAEAEPVDGNGTILPEDQPVITSIVIEE